MVVVGSLSSLVIHMWRPSMCFLLQFNLSSLFSKHISWHSFSLLLSLGLANHSNEVKVTTSRNLNQTEKVVVPHLDTNDEDDDEGYCSQTNSDNEPSRNVNGREAPKRAHKPPITPLHGHRG